MSNVISGASVWTPPHQIPNAELVASYNAHADRYNAEHAAEIASGRRDAKPRSSVEFIEKGIMFEVHFIYSFQSL